MLLLGSRATGASHLSRCPGGCRRQHALEQGRGWGYWFDRYVPLLSLSTITVIESAGRVGVPASAGQSQDSNPPAACWGPGSSRDSNQPSSGIIHSDLAAIPVAGHGTGWGA